MFDMLKFSLEGDTFSLAKRALIFIEGEHKDSMGRVHEFSQDRVKKFVDNTNNFLRQGGRLPFQRDHKKTQEFNIGDVEGELYVKTIDETDLPDSRYKHLIGKMGVFADNIVGRGQKVVEDIKNGLIKTLSPGMDPMTESFIEISATPVPAIIGPALFSKEGGEVDNYILFEAMNMNAISSAGPSKPDSKKEALSYSPKEKPFSFEELESSKVVKERRFEEYERITEGLFEILTALHDATDEELLAKEVNPIEASYDAIEHFLDKVESMFELVDEAEMTEEAPEVETSNGQGKQPFPVGKTASDYNRQNYRMLEFGKKSVKPIGYIRK